MLGQYFLCDQQNGDKKDLPDAPCDEDAQNAVAE
jgi:hypothetical protein